MSKYNLKSFYILLIILILFTFVFSYFNLPKKTLFNDNSYSIDKAINTYFYMPKFLKENVESKEYKSLSTEEANKYLQKIMINKYQEFFSGKLLNEYIGYIKKFNYSTRDYNYLYSTIETANIYKKEVNQKRKDFATCNVYLRDLIYLDFIMDPEGKAILKSLTKEYKISNYTQDEINNMVDIKGIDLDVQGKIIFNLKKIKNSWYIYKQQYEKLETKLKIYQ